MAAAARSLEDVPARPAGWGLPARQVLLHPAPLLAPPGIGDHVRSARAGAVLCWDCSQRRAFSRAALTHVGLSQGCVFTVTHLPAFVNSCCKRRCSFAAEPKSVKQKDPGVEGKGSSPVREQPDASLEHGDIQQSTPAWCKPLPTLLLAVCPPVRQRRCVWH